TSFCINIIDSTLTVVAFKFQIAMVIKTVNNLRWNFPFFCLTARRSYCQEQNTYQSDIYVH
ncbi:hypothetical protein, partial [Escherichia coli]|uniref:hypothetical protein n=1 Tax=Escherichia coli TaxID=562 RepID=UPI001CC6D9FD